MDRSVILNKELEISANNINWCFISDYYDAPIEGLLYYKNAIWKFCCFKEDVPEQAIYVILQLSKEELETEIEEKERFEKMVGTHWSFGIDGKKLPDSNATPETQKKYYESKGKSAEFSPHSHKVEAWFDVSN